MRNYPLSPRSLLTCRSPLAIVKKITWILGILGEKKQIGRGKLIRTSSYTYILRMSAFIAWIGTRV